MGKGVLDLPKQTQEALVGSNRVVLSSFLTGNYSPTFESGLTTCSFLRHLFPH